MSRALISERLHPRGTLRRFFFSPVCVEKEGLRLQNEFLPFSQIRGENTFLKRVFEFTVGRSLFRIHTEKDAFLLLSLTKLGKARFSSPFLDGLLLGEGKGDGPGFVRSPKISG
ncbi:MAG: hypothetical protein ACUVTO_03815 [Candidatus Caldatribacteriaceae bacterium]